jgi:hypothetical protein
MSTAYRLTPQQQAHQRRPRIMDEKHLKCIRQLPCIVSLRVPVEAAHVRFASSEHNKPESGLQVRPDDKWCVPLHTFYHRDGQEAQHKGNEEAFWYLHNIDVLRVCEDLYRATGDMDRMRNIVIRAHRGDYAWKE